MDARHYRDAIFNRARVEIDKAAALALNRAVINRAVVAPDEQAAVRPDIIFVGGARDVQIFDKAARADCAE